MKVLVHPMEFGFMTVVIKSEDKIPVPDFDDESDDKGTPTYREVMGAMTYRRFIMIVVVLMALILILSYFVAYR